MTRRILVVDDDRQMVKTLCDIFRLRGWDTQAAYSGVEAVEAVANGTFAVVLMDIKMPAMNGVDALRAIRASHPAMRVVLMTAYAASELIEQAIAAGAMRVLAKPVAVTEVLELIEREDAATVLIVDDDPAFLHTMSDLLAVSGYPVSIATTLTDALRLLEQKAAGVVLLDVRLGDVPPGEAIVAVREMHPSAVLILCSGYPQLLHETADRMPPDWIYARLEKPFSPDLLLALLDDIN